MPSAFMNTEATIARVLLADDHAEILTQTGNVLAGEFEIVGSVGNGVDLIKAAVQLDPDVVVLDITCRVWMASKQPGGSSTPGAAQSLCS